MRGLVNIAWEEILIPLLSHVPKRGFSECSVTICYLCFLPKVSQSIIPLVACLPQKSKELGMCENEFKYRMEKRDIVYNKFAEEVRKSMN